MRRDMRGRSLVNMDAIRGLLERRGFSIVEPEELSIAHQAAAFASADVVVGVMGATLTNTVFCRPRTRVIHLAPEGWLEPFYWDLAAVRGHRYAACYGPALDGGPAHLSSFTLPEHSLLNALRALDC
jgi:capsular polysaccharide biosynthesis protein